MVPAKSQSRRRKNEVGGSRRPHRQGVVEVAKRERGRASVLVRIRRAYRGRDSGVVVELSIVSRGPPPPTLRSIVGGGGRGGGDRGSVLSHEVLGTCIGGVFVYHRDRERRHAHAGFCCAGRTGCERAATRAVWATRRSARREHRLFRQLFTCLMRCARSIHAK